ncbi:MAG TPA: SIS domain-containing protein [Anaerolineales bacterium]|nr:SIS domain-containing protein [Anaerolineales bacterium]
MTLHSEIMEQPARLESLLRSQRKNAETIARAIKSSGISYVFLTARGTSDNAGRYANYLLGAVNHLPLALATPSLFTYYKQPPRLKGALVIGISQSGQSPDIVSVLEEGKRQGCLTLAVTNEPDAPLGKIADLVFPILAGPERAVAATKTYTSELAAIAMLSAALSEDPRMWDELGHIPGYVQEALQLDEKARQAAERYRYMQQCVVLGRGFNYATAFEWALKLKELTYVEAEPYSSADFQHGPIAMVARGFPVMAVLSSGVLASSLLSFLKHLKDELLAELVIISNWQEALELGQARFAISASVPEALSPIVNIIPAQLFAYHLTLARGYDADHPRTIQKVTETR